MMNKKGFTLVELSIVLVIIGLLIGGILVAQSMVGTVRIQKFVSQIQQFDVAAVNFHTKYNGIPGDTSRFGCVSAGNTCNDGILQDTGGNNNPGAGWVQNFTGEIANYWVDLQKSGLTNPTVLTATVTGGVKANVNTPEMALGKAGVLPYYDTVSGSYGVQPVNYYAIGNWSPSGMTYLWSPSPKGTVTSQETLAVDQKMDNGISNTGNVLGVGTADFIDNGNCSTSGKYNKTDMCMVLIKMQSQTGT